MKLDIPEWCRKEVTEIKERFLDQVPDEDEIRTLHALQCVMIRRLRKEKVGGLDG